MAFSGTHRRRGLVALVVAVWSSVPSSVALNHGVGFTARGLNLGLGPRHRY